MVHGFVSQIEKEEENYAMKNNLSFFCTKFIVHFRVGKKGCALVGGVCR